MLDITAPPIFILIIFSLHSFFFFFNDTATTEIYTLSLHDALPILTSSRHTIRRPSCTSAAVWIRGCSASIRDPASNGSRSEEHTSELQSQSNLVCRLLLEKKKKNIQYICYLTSRRMNRQ